MRLDLWDMQVFLKFTAVDFTSRSTNICFFIFFDTINKFKRRKRTGFKDSALGPLILGRMTTNQDWVLYVVLLPYEIRTFLDSVLLIQYRYPIVLSVFPLEQYSTFPCYLRVMSWYGVGLIRSVMKWEAKPKYTDQHVIQETYYQVYSISTTARATLLFPFENALWLINMSYVENSGNISKGKWCQCRRRVIRDRLL